MSSAAFVYDTGMLIALERQDTAAHMLHRVLAERGHAPVVPLPVLAQAWRPGRWTPLTRLIPQCVIFGVRADSPPPCGVCLAGHTEEDARRAGRLLAIASIPQQKRPDAVDALAVVIAARHVEAVLVTSDPQDLAAYRDELTECRSGVLILHTADIAGFLAGKRILR